MKTLTKSMAIVAVAATMLSACSENETAPIQTENGLYSYTFELGDPETRATYGTTAINWKSGDKIGVYAKTTGGENSVNKYSTVTTGTPCTINVYSTVALAAGDSVFFSYPYRSSLNIDVPLGHVRFAIPTQQTNGDADVMPMVSEPYTMTSAAALNTNVAIGKVYFSNLGSIIRFKFYDSNANSATIKSVTFKANQAIAGVFEKDLSSINFSNASTLAISGYSEKTITTFVSNTAIGTTADGTASVVGMVVAPGSYTGNVIVTTTDGSTYTVPITTAQNCARNSVRTLNINLKNYASSLNAAALKQTSVVLNESQVGVRWSTNNFTDPQSDIADTYKFSVYNDAACSDLRFTWTFTAGKGEGYSTSVVVSNIWTWQGYYWFPGVIVSGLAPSTTYYVKITDETKSLTSTQEYTTTASKVIDVTKIGNGAATAGQTILFEDFSQFFNGSNSVYGLSGYSSDLRSSSDTMVTPSGPNPCLDNTTKKIFNVKIDYHSGLFNTFAKLVANSRLKTWTTYVEANLNSAMCIQAGQLKMGASNKTGDIITPPLNCLSGTATLEIQFDAAPYVEGSRYYLEDFLTAVVEVFPNSPTILNTSWVNYTVSTNVPTNTKEVTLNPEDEFNHYTVTLTGVPAGARIGIGPKISEKKNAQHRMYLDNIQIKVVSYD